MFIAEIFSREFRPVLLGSKTLWIMAMCVLFSLEITIYIVNPRDWILFFILFFLSVWNIVPFVMDHFSKINMK